MKVTYRSKVFDISTLDGLKQAEREKERLYSEYHTVNTNYVGIEKIQFIAHKE